MAKLQFHPLLSFLQNINTVIITKIVLLHPNDMIYSLHNLVQYLAKAWEQKQLISLWRVQDVNKNELYYLKSSW